MIANIIFLYFIFVELKISIYHCCSQKKTVGCPATMIQRCDGEWNVYKTDYRRRHQCTPFIRSELRLNKRKRTELEKVFEDNINESPARVVSFFSFFLLLFINLFLGCYVLHVYILYECILFFVQYKKQFHDLKDPQDATDTSKFASLSSIRRMKEKVTKLKMPSSRYIK